MKVAHLILAHKNPEQLFRLIKNLSHENFDFYIHIDKNADIRDFQNSFTLANVFPIKQRTEIYWAGFGTIQAILNGFREIPGINYTHINVISGQDFPLKKAAYIYDYISSRKHTEFITCESIYGEWKEAAPRFLKYSFINWRIPGKFRLEKIANFLLPPRKFPFKHEIVGRANWFTLTPPAIKYILDFINEHPEVIRYYKYCWGADEFIFSTILYNSSFRDNIVPNLIYVDWTEKKAHPKVLNSDDFSKLIQSDKLFARKFDFKLFPEIFDQLEEYIGST